MKSLLATALLMSGLGAHAMDLTLSTPNDGDALNAPRTLVLDGVIEPEDARKVDHILAGRFKDGSRTILLMSSPGGALEAVDPLVNVIVHQANRFYRKFHRPLIFAVNAQCDSACGILAAGLTFKRQPESLEILVQRESRFMFHHPKEMVNGQIQDYRDAREGQAAYSRMMEAYLGYSVSSRWLRQMQRYFNLSGGFYETAGQLCADYTHILPDDSCSNLDQDSFLNQIIQVYTDDGAVGSDSTIQKSISRTIPQAVINFLGQLFTKAH